MRGALLAILVAFIVLGFPIYYLSRGREIYIAPVLRHGECVVYSSDQTTAPIVLPCSEVFPQFHGK